MHKKIIKINCNFDNRLLKNYIAYIKKIAQVKKDVS